MDKCLNCSNELVGRQRTFCSDKCRMQLNRQDNEALGLTDSEQNRTELPPNSVRVESEQSRILTQEMLDSLPPGVVKPTGQLDAATAKLTRQELTRAVERLNPWQGSSAYAEVVYRRYVA